MTPVDRPPAWLAHAGVALSLGVLAATAWLAWLPFVRDPINLYDEGLILSAVQRLRLGDVLYRDITSMYGPLPYALTAALDTAGVPALFAWRGVVLASQFGVVLLAFAMTRRLAGLLPAALVGMTLIATPAIAWGLLLPLAAIALLATGRRPWQLLLAGVLLGLGLAVKHEVAVYALLAVTVALASFGTGAVWWQRVWHSGPWLAGGMLVGAAPFGLFLLLAGALPSAIDDLLITSARQIGAMALPWPGAADIIDPAAPTDLAVGRLLTALAFYSSFVIYPLALMVAGHRAFLPPAQRWLVAALAVFGCLLLASQLVRADATHVWFASVPARILGAGLLAWAIAGRAAWPAAWRLAGVGSGVAVLALPVLLTGGMLVNLGMPSRAPLDLHPLPNADTPVFEGEANAVQFPLLAADVARLSPAGSPVLVVPGDTPIVSALIGRPSPLREDWFIEGIYTPERLATALARLEAEPPALVILRPSLVAGQADIRRQLRHIGAEPLLDWVEARYAPVSTGRGYIILAPRAASVSG